MSVFLHINQIQDPKFWFPGLCFPHYSSESWHESIQREQRYSSAHS